MSSLQKRAWLALWSMCPVYCVYFVIQIGLPYLQPTMLERIACLAVVASLHAVGYICGLLVIKRHEAGEPLLEDERDRAIDGRATRTAYFILLTGMIVVGMVMPFNNGGWKLVNAALFFIVLTETARYALILIGYRRPRLAH
jgi:hypothetical protein